MSDRSKKRKAESDLDAQPPPSPNESKNGSQSESDESQGSSSNSHSDSSASSSSSSGSDSPASWQSAFRSALQAAKSPEEIRSLKDELLKLIDAADSRLISNSTDISDLLVLTSSNESQANDIPNNAASWTISSKFSFGPNQTEFRFGIEIYNQEGDITMNVNTKECSIDQSPCADDQVDLDLSKMEDFLTRSGINLDTYYPSNVKNRKQLIYCQVVDQALECLMNEYGCENDCGVEMAMQQGDLKQWLKLKE
jgi:hypothetical protein